MNTQTNPPEATSLNDLASECADRTTHPRRWIIARNYISRVFKAEALLAEALEALDVLANPNYGARATGEDAREMARFARESHEAIDRKRLA